MLKGENAMSALDLLVRAASPSPSPTSGPGAQADITLSNYFLATLLFSGAIVVIILALAFALIYHKMILRVIRKAAKRGAPVISEVDGVGIQSKVTQPVETKISGPKDGAPSAKLEYTLEGVTAGATVTWVAENGDPSKGEGPTFATRFDKPGSYRVTATATESAGSTKDYPKDVTIAAPGGTAGSPIVLPFVIKNWGRLVIVIFGVGVISALMSTKILDAAAGIGILGTLLGVGAATSGSSADKPPTPPST